MLFIDLLQSFVIDTIRNLLIEGLCDRVRRHTDRRAARRKRRRLAEFAVHKLITDRRRKR